MVAIKALRFLLGMILCLAVGISLWLAIQRQVLHREPAALLGRELWTVEEDTMAPALSSGDLIMAASQQEYALGDVVLCPQEGTVAPLRLIGSTGDDFIARGDSQAEGEERLLTPGEIRGKVTAALPGAGGAYRFFSSWWGAPVLLVIGILLLALPWLLGVGREPREQREAPPSRRPRHAR